MDIQRQELQVFEGQLNAYLKGKLTAEDFRKVRVWQGVYTIRGSSERYLIRIRIPQGEWTPAGLEGLARIVEKNSAVDRIHITTRQGVEIYEIPIDRLMNVLYGLHEVGLTSRSAGGNGVRNITTCPLSGIASGEAFDVTPYAKMINDYFIRNPLAQHLPRKVKIAFEGCPDKDHIRAMIHDIGAFAALKGHEQGFQIYVGGGLGGAPRQAQLLEDFTSCRHLLATVEAILTVFDQHGGRQSKDRARLKFLIQDWGVDRFRSAVFPIREKILAEGRTWPKLKEEEQAPKISFSSQKKSHPHDETLQRWLKYNVIAQKQPGYFAVFIRCPFGDVSKDQFKKIAQISQKYCGGKIRTTITQNFVLRWIRQENIHDLYQELKPLGLAQCCAEHVMDMTRCAGANSCLSALTKSKGLAVELSKIFSNGLSQDPEIFNLVIKVSGCPHACGHHPIANIGFHGASRNIQGHPVPHYQMLLGGYTEKGKSEFAKPLILIPAKKVPETLQHLLKFYLANRIQKERFLEFVRRIEFSKLKDELSPFTTLPPYEKDPEAYKDWDSDQIYKIDAQKGECFA